VDEHLHGTGLWDERRGVILSTRRVSFEPDENCAVFRATKPKLEDENVLHDEGVLTQRWLEALKNGE